MKSTKKEREIADKLFKFGLTKYRIGKILGYPRETICYWLTPGRKERCKKAYTKWVKKNPKKNSTRWYDWYKRNKTEYDKKHGQKVITRHKTREMVKTGKIKKLPCEICGELKTQAHHENYEDPLSVIWLCSKHHREIHKELED